jgi:O-antigen/teichoic acid export membrane protein
MSYQQVWRRARIGPLRGGPPLGDAAGHGPTERRLVHKVASLVGGRAGGNLLTLFYTLLLARITEPADFGLVMAGFAWTMLLSIGLALNVESGSIKYVVRYQQGAAPGHVAGFLRFNLYTVLILTIAVALAGLLVWANGWVNADEPQVQMLALALLAAPVVALTRVYGRHATALGEVLRGGLPITFVRPAVICALFFAVWAVEVRPDAVMAMLLMLAAFTVTALLQAYLLRHTFAFARRARPDYRDAAQWLTTGGAMAPLLLMRDNLKHVVVASAGLTVGLADIGYVGLGFSIMSLVYFSVKAVDIALSAQLSHALQSRTSVLVQRTLQSAARLKLLVLIAGTVGVTGFGTYGLTLFGPDYAAAFAPMVILMLIPAADALFGAAQIALNVVGRQSAVFWSAGGSSAILVAAVALGGWMAGAPGVAAGAAISYCGQQILLWWVCRKTTGIDTSILCLWRAPPQMT